LRYAVSLASFERRCTSRVILDAGRDRLEAFSLWM
jgi:hypothetical protein